MLGCTQAVGSRVPRLSRPADRLDGRVRMCLRVEPPSRLRISPAVHRQGDQVDSPLVMDEHGIDLPEGGFRCLRRYLALWLFALPVDEEVRRGL
jgi:hypothetical protein